MVAKQVKLGETTKKFLQIHTSEMLKIIDNLNKSNTLTSDSRLVGFDIINMFPSIDNISGLKAVKSILNARQDQFLSTVNLK